MVFCTGFSRCCQTRTAGSGASPCSTKCSVPPGTSTRRSSASAPATSGIVHIVQVDSAESKLLSGNGSALPSKPARSIGTRARATRGAANRQPRSAGSTAVTEATVSG